MGPDVPARPLATARSRSSAREYAEVLLVAIVLALFVRTFLVQAFVVPSSSMETTVLVGDHLLVNKFLYAPHGRGGLSRLLPYRPVARGDVIVFKFPEDPHRDFVKRVVALPGDTLEIRDKEVFVNGRPEREPRARHSEQRTWRNDAELPESLRRRDQVPPTRISDGSYFAMGDNRDDSYDSRFWGPVPQRNVKGRALLVYWSLPPAAPGRGVLGRLGDFFSKTRWSRTLLPVR